MSNIDSTNTMVRKKEPKFNYRLALDMVRKLATRFDFDVDEARRHLFRKFATLTLGDMAENGVEMEKSGTAATHGYSMEMMTFLKGRFEACGAVCEAHDLNEGLIGSEFEGQGEPAQLLIVRGGVNAILGDPEGSDKLEKEVDKDTTMDSQVWSRKHGGIVNKNARFNNTFGPVAQKADIANKKGTIVSYDQVPLLKKIVDWFYEAEKVFYGKEEIARMVVEGNYYYDESCGIGRHGDTERWKAIGIRLGLCAPLGYRWRIYGKGVGKKMVFNFEHGTMYIMSQKAVGRFWKRRASLQLVHAAGAEKYMKQLDK